MSSKFRSVMALVILAVCEVFGDLFGFLSLVSVEVADLFTEAEIEMKSLIDRQRSESMEE